MKGTINTKDTIQVCRNEKVYEEISTTDLVPGDVILIPATGCEVQCDAVLLNGSCVVNESMLTGRFFVLIQVRFSVWHIIFVGESVPITKTALPNNSNQFSLKEDNNHILFCGTRVIQTRVKGKSVTSLDIPLICGLFFDLFNFLEGETILAVVIRTGYLTTKGELVRSILYPPPADFKFETDSYKFIGILSFIAIGSVIYTIVSKVHVYSHHWILTLVQCLFL